ncbi:hypothetical protein ACWGJQ_22210 [Peribacillus simplex]|uniref:hypothetical protein n=1 Tax=Bacillus sp. B4EP4a TaxID=2590665 RepID=UPI00115164C5|nr:hypothetical protein [Bacillus sp. B4EP4a]
MQKRVKRKLFHLYTGELMATVIFAVLWVSFLMQHDWTDSYLTSFSSVYAFVLLEFILLQGSLYWFLKWKRAKENDYAHLPYTQLRIFLFFKRVNLFLIATGIVVFFYQLKAVESGIYWYLFLYVFAIIEHINYYHFRLSYQSPDEMKELIRQRGLRKSILAKELNELKKDFTV